jgi:hypothetical protein
VSTTERIEARFRSRIVGKPHTYSEETMREVLIAVLPISVAHLW